MISLRNLCHPSEEIISERVKAITIFKNIHFMNDVLKFFLDHRKPYLSSCYPFFLALR